MKFLGDTLNFCDFIQVFVFPPNHHLNCLIIISLYIFIDQSFIALIHCNLYFFEKRKRMIQCMVNKITEKNQSAAGAGGLGIIRGNKVEESE